MENHQGRSGSAGVPGGGVHDEPDDAVFRRVPLRRDHADVPRLLPGVGFLNEAAENVHHVPEHGRLRAHALHPLHRCTRAVFLTLGVGCRYQQTSNGSFSAVSKPMFSIKYLLE